MARGQMFSGPVDPDHKAGLFGEGDPKRMKIPFETRLRTQINKFVMYPIALKIPTPMNHKKSSSVIIVLLGICFTAVPLLGADGTNLSSASHRPDLEYLKAVNQVAPPRDPQTAVSA